MEPALTIYIDEAGDPGVRDGLRYLGERHEWLCLGAVAVRSSRDADLVGWVKELRTEARSTQSGALHYNRITLERRPGVCSLLGTKPARAFVMASHKSNLREYINPRLQQMIDAGKMYNWCIRLLLERVTAWAETWQRQELKRLEGLRVIFARRGHDWDHFFSYVETLRWQSENGKLFLKGPGLNPALLDQSHWSLSQPEQYAGLQLADTVASAFYQAANTASPSYNVVPAQNLKTIMATKGGAEANCGVTVWPLPHQAPFPEASKPVFRAYGYKF
jgi:hypothetical protein